MRSQADMARKGSTYRCPSCGQSVTVLVTTYIPVCSKHTKGGRLMEEVE